MSPAIFEAGVTLWPSSAAIGVGHPLVASVSVVPARIAPSGSVVCRAGESASFAVAVGHACATLGSWSFLSAKAPLVFVDLGPSGVVSFQSRAPGVGQLLNPVSSDGVPFVGRSWGTCPSF